MAVVIRREHAKMAELNELTSVAHDVTERSAQLEALVADLERGRDPQLVRQASSIYLEFGQLDSNLASSYSSLKDVFRDVFTAYYLGWVRLAPTSKRLSSWAFHVESSDENPPSSSYVEPFGSLLSSRASNRKRETLDEEALIFTVR